MDAGQGPDGTLADAGRDALDAEGWDAPLVAVGIAEPEEGPPPALPSSSTQSAGTADDGGGVGDGGISPLAEDGPSAPAVDDGLDGPSIDAGTMDSIVERLDICIDILLFGDVLLALLLGCLCASIFSRALLMRR